MGGGHALADNDDRHGRYQGRDATREFRDRPCKAKQEWKNEGTEYKEERECGQVLGGALGAILGDQVGDGSGRVIATVGGAVIGALVGGGIGRKVDRDDQAFIGQTLEYGARGQQIGWTSVTGTQYRVVPGGTCRAGGRDCRQFEARVLTPQGWQSAPGRACRRADGVWVAA